ncbi:MAG: tryptophan-rich sensory protein [Bacteroidetes bacterium]|nr:tryptophan-rich sensory protein [Bacteroidota bacterium]
MYLRLAIFLVLNFGGLAIGGIFTGAGVTSQWYAELAKAPWTPPGWVFGASWTTIMICFSVYMAYAWENIDNRILLISLYVVQWILNVGWNPVFFYYHEVLWGLIIISALTVLVGYFFLGFTSEMKAKIWLMAPYFVWLVIATSLNAYVLFNN